jgi:hypothetical protein
LKAAWGANTVWEHWTGPIQAGPQVRCVKARYWYRRSSENIQIDCCARDARSHVYLVVLKFRDYFFDESEPRACTTRYSIYYLFQRQGSAYTGSILFNARKERRVPVKVRTQPQCTHVQTDIHMKTITYAQTTPTTRSRRFTSVRADIF